MGLRVIASAFDHPTDFDPAQVINPPHATIREEW